MDTPTCSLVHHHPFVLTPCPNPSLYDQSTTLLQDVQEYKNILNKNMQAGISKGIKNIAGWICPKQEQWRIYLEPSRLKFSSIVICEFQCLQVCSTPLNILLKTNFAGFN